MNDERLLNILLSPVVSEKSSRLAEAYGHYLFKVLPDATKHEIGNAVEKLFDVKVKHVRVVNVPGKRKRAGARAGKRKNWRKAYVCLKSGYEINFSSQ